MSKPLFWESLLLATALSAGTALAQTPSGTPAPSDEPATPDQPEADAQLSAVDEDGVDVDMPGITVTGIRERNIQKATSEVVSVLSTEDIARTGEGDIAGALARVTGMSVDNNGFVYVRGLGDRYSLALLNGSPLPSPEPMRRSVPLDLFPTDVVASSLVQKTYSPTITGEFGGGVINLTTLSTPKEPFFSIGAGMSGDSETTQNVGYDYYGGYWDWTGYESGLRDPTPALAEFLRSGERMSSGAVDTTEIAKGLVRPDNALIQRIDEVPFNWGASMSGGTSWWVGNDTRIGLVAAGSYKNEWRTRDNLEQTPGSADLSVIDHDYRRVITDNNLVANALVGLNFEFSNDSKLRWTNFYIHDTLKRASLASGFENAQSLGSDFLEQNTGWYERQLLGTQLSGEMNWDSWNLGARASYSNSKREAPDEIWIGYERSNQAASPYGAYFLNRLDNGQTGYAKVAYSDLDEDLMSGGVDLTKIFSPTFRATIGYDYTDTERDSTRREFQIVAPATLPNGIAMQRPDYLLGSGIIEHYGIGLVETTESDPAFGAELRTHAAYLQFQTEFSDAFELSFGARYETGEQDVYPIQVFNTLSNSGASTHLENDYVLPAATLTWRFADGMQARLNASQTIARPQFRELMFQTYFDPESNREYRGNPLLVDSEFFNAEGRFEWYFASEERVSAAAFYKKIDKPIESFTGFNDNTTVTSFANAPEAELYGAEFEMQKYFSVSDSRRAVLIGNYTYTNSTFNVGAGDTVSIYGTTTQPATNFFRDGSQLTGQSDHIVNLQFGLEQSGRLSQQTLLLNYASDRVTSRGASGLPDIYESPGFKVDLVLRQGFTLFQQDVEAKFEARNLLGEGYEEFQEREGNVVYYNKYDIGTMFSLSVSMNF